MASGTRTTDSFSEGLRKVLGNIQDLKMSDDADMSFTINLETMLLQRLKQQGSDALQGPTNGLGAAVASSPGPTMLPPGGGMPQGMPPPGLGMPPGMAPAAPQGGMMPPGAAGPAIGPAAVPGLMQGPNMPNVDELRRLLSTGTTALRLNNVARKLGGM